MLLPPTVRGVWWDFHQTVNTGYSGNDSIASAQARQCLSARETRVISLLFDVGWTNREVAAT